MAVSAKLFSYGLSACSGLAFTLVVVALAIDQWTYDAVYGQTRGLWRNVSIETAPEMEGLEITRGTAIVGGLLSLVTVVLAVYNMASYIFPERKISKFETAMVYGSGVTVFYLCLSIGSFTYYWASDSRFSQSDISAISYYLMCASAALFMLQFLALILIPRNSTSEIYETEQTESKEITTDENAERGNWDSKYEYLLSMVGFAVGLGNFWRFPYLAYENGGGAFLIPYVIMLCLAGIPLFFMEVSIAQFQSAGPVKLWNLSPAFRGIGMMMVIYSCYVGVYYNMVIGYAFYYFFAVFANQVPWMDCSGYWNAGTECTTEVSNTTSNATEFKFVSPADTYYNQHVLKVLPMDDENSMQLVWQCVVALAIAWTVVFFALIRGIKSSGKVMWVSALLPYAILLILLIKGLTLPGASEGLSYYIGSNSKFEKLSDLNVWRAAATQIFFSLSIGWGGLHALSSYNNFNNNCCRDAIVVCLINCATSIFAGLVIFAILGNMATTLGVDVDKVVEDGRTLVFVAYPYAMTQLPPTPLWSALFFIMLITLGLDTVFTILETVATSVSDVWPNVLKSRRSELMALICIVLFSLGLLTCTRAGIYWIDVFDEFTGGWGLLLSTLVELVVVGTYYGGGLFTWKPWRPLVRGENERLIEDIEIMIGRRSEWFWLIWRFLWYIISPLLLAVLMVWGLVTYEDNPNYSQVGIIVGWVILGSGLVCLPITMIYEFMNTKSIKAIQPNDQHGPYLDKHRVGTRYDRRPVGERFNSMVEAGDMKEVTAAVAKANLAFQEDDGTDFSVTQKEVSRSQSIWSTNL